MIVNQYQQAFTLLEILISITLTSLVIGSLFVLQSNSSKLAFNAANKVDNNITLRAALNHAMLISNSDELSDNVLANYHYKIANKKLLNIPALSPERLHWRLEKFDIVDSDNNVLISSVRFKNINQ